MTPEFQLFDVLTRHGVPFVVMGGHAVNFHGFVRATEDTDVLWIRSPAAEENLLRALDELAAEYIGNEIDPAFVQHCFCKSPVCSWPRRACEPWEGTHRQRDLKTLAIVDGEELWFDAGVLLVPTRRIRLDLKVEDIPLAGKDFKHDPRRPRVDVLGTHRPISRAGIIRVVNRHPIRPGGDAITFFHESDDEGTIGFDGSATHVAAIIKDHITDAQWRAIHEGNPSNDNRVPAAAGCGEKRRHRNELHETGSGHGVNAFVGNGAAHGSVTFTPSSTADRAMPTDVETVTAMERTDPSAMRKFATPGCALPNAYLKT